MGRRRSRREPGRPTLLDKDTETKLIEATKVGAPMTAAAEYSGISVRTFEDWMKRGYNEQASIDEGHDADPVEAKYLDLFQKIRGARSLAAVASGRIIRKVAIGGQGTEEAARKYRDVDGQVVEEKTVKKTASDWRAAAWYLERQHGADFGKQSTVKQEVSGEVHVTVAANDLAARVRANVEAAAAKEAALLESRTQEAEQLRAIESGPAGTDDVVEGEVVE